MNVMSRPPVQRRSRETLAALVAAAERLVDERPFADISIQDICAAAGCTTGSFYGRFRSKEDLLPYLHDAHDARLAARLEATLASRDWEPLSLAAALEVYIRQTIAACLEHPSLLREIVLFARRSGRSRPLCDAADARVAAMLARKVPKAPPGEAAFILATLSTVIRETTLFNSAGQPAADREDLVRRLIWMGLVHLETRT